MLKKDLGDLYKSQKSGITGGGRRLTPGEEREERWKAVKEVVRLSLLCELEFSGGAHGGYSRLPTEDQQARKWFNREKAGRYAR